MPAVPRAPEAATSDRPASGAPRRLGSSWGQRIGRLPLVRALDRQPWAWRVVGALVLAAAAWHVVDSFLVTYPDEIWQVDLEVYREGARSLLEGRPVYDWLTDAPQYLPFTYPPFAALVGLPLAAAPLEVVGWTWTVVQLVLLWFVTGMAFRPLIERAGVRAGLAQGAVAAVLVQLQPSQDGIRYGQVNAVLVALCLADVARRRRGWWPHGALVGLAAAIKLTPAVFWVHWLVTRRWRVLGASVATAALATGLTALYAPSASLAYWTDALLDPGRLGPNADTANQSLRGVLLRLGPPEGPLLTLAWFACVLVVGVLGFGLTARLERLGEPVAVVAATGMIAFLVSPVSWIHHMYWGLVAVGALLGNGRSTARVAAAVGAAAVLFSKLAWMGQSLRSRGGWQSWLGGVEQQAYCWLALAVLLALWLLLVRGRADSDRDGSTDTADPTAGATGERTAAGAARLAP